MAILEETKTRDTHGTGGRRHRNRTAAAAVALAWMAVAGTASAQVAQDCTDPPSCFQVSVEPVVPTPADTAVLTVLSYPTPFIDLVARPDFTVDMANHAIYLTYDPRAASPTHPRSAQFALPRLPAGTYRIYALLLLDLDPFPIPHIADLTIATSPAVPAIGERGDAALVGLLVLLGAMSARRST